MESVAAALITQTSAEGGVIAGAFYHLAYGRDMYGVFRGYMALGLHDYARRMVAYMCDTYRAKGFMPNASGMGMSCSHRHENDEVEQTGYYLLELLDYAEEKMPTMLEWKTMAENDSMYNTPPCYTIYMAKLVYEWILSLGGLDKMKEMNEKKANLLYDYLDNQNYYIAPVKKDSRSMMNVTFVTESDELNAKFVKEATEAGFVNLKGHRSVGGMRASIYNAMPIEGVEKLVDFMKAFEAANK